MGNTDESLIEESPNLMQKILLTTLSVEDLSEPADSEESDHGDRQLAPSSRRRSSMHANRGLRGRERGHRDYSPQEDAGDRIHELLKPHESVEVVEHGRRRSLNSRKLSENRSLSTSQSPSGTNSTAVLSLNGTEAFSNAQNQVRSAEHAAKIARLEAEEWRFHAQSLQASLERQRQMQAIASPERSNPSTPGTNSISISRQTSFDPWEDLAASKRQIADQQDCIGRRDAALARAMQRCDKLKKKCDSLVASENSLIQRLNTSQADINEMQAALDSQEDDIAESNDILTQKDAEIKLLKHQLAKSSLTNGLQVSRPSDLQHASNELDQVRHKLAMERAISKQLQSQLASKHDEVTQLKASFKATLEDHRRRQISIGQVLSKLQLSQVKP